MREDEMGGAEIAAGRVGLAQQRLVVERVQHEHASFDASRVEKTVQLAVVLRASHGNRRHVHIGEPVSVHGNRAVGRRMFEHQSERLAKHAEALGRIGPVKLGFKNAAGAVAGKHFLREPLAQ